VSYRISPNSGRRAATHQRFQACLIHCSSGKREPQLRFHRVDVPTLLGLSPPVGIMINLRFDFRAALDSAASVGRVQGPEACFRRTPRAALRRTAVRYASPKGKRVWGRFLPLRSGAIR